MKLFSRDSEPLMISEPIRFPGAAAWLSVILLVVSASHLAVLAADPPAWVEEAFIVDGGWWASSARAKVLFGDYFSGEFGVPYLLLPAYSWTLEIIYANWGVGLAQTRILSAISNIAVVVIVAVIVWRMAGRREAIFAVALLGFNPFFWSQGRVELPEPMQTLFIVLSFALWFLPRHSRHSMIGAMSAGLAMALAIAVKPTALLMGLLPVSLAGLAVYFVERAQKNADIEASKRERTRTTGVRALLAFSVLLLSLGTLFFVHWLPHWEIIQSNFSTEKGIYGLDWRQTLTIPGRALVSKEISEEGGFSPILWRVAKWSPAVVVGVWLYFLRLLFQFRAGIGHSLKSLSVLEIATLAWVVCGWITICTYPGQPDYRYVPLVPAFAILSALFYSRALASRDSVNHSLPVGSRGIFFSFCLWAVLLFPLFLVAKPWAVRLVMAIAPNLPLGDQPGIEYGAAGTLFTAAWFSLLVALSGFRRGGEQLGSLVLSHSARILFLFLLLFQCITIGYSLARAETTLVDHQVALVGYVEEGEIVAGRMAGTLFLPLPVHTVRRLSPATPSLETFDSPAKLKLEHAAQPVCAVIPRQFNFRPYRPYRGIAEDLVADGYQAVYRFDVGPRRSGVPRFEFELLRRNLSNSTQH